MDKTLLECLVAGGLGIVLGTVVILALIGVFYIAFLFGDWIKDIIEDLRESKWRKIWETDVAENVGAKLFPSKKDAEKWIAANPDLNYKMWGSEEGIIVRYEK